MKILKDTRNRFGNIESYLIEISSEEMIKITCSDVRTFQVGEEVDAGVVIDRLITIIKELL